MGSPRFVLCNLSKVLVVLGAMVLIPHANADILPSGASRPQPQPVDPVLMGRIIQSEYILGPGDIINVEDEVMGAQGTALKIVSDGSIHMKLIGKVYVGGLSIDQATELLNEAYSKYYINPSISIQVTYQRPVRVYVHGAVQSPGPRDGGKNLARVGAAESQLMYYRFTLTDALIQAGGLAYNADVSDIRVVRTFPQKQVFHINLWDMFEGNVVQDFVLRDQDVIEVAEVPKEQLVMDARWEDLLRSNISTNDFRVHVVGEVAKPGVYNVKPDDTVLDAVAEAGGFSVDANKKKVYVLRKNSNGQVFGKAVNLGDKNVIRQKPLDEVARLLPGDVVFVDDSKSKKSLRKVGALAQSSFQAGSFAFFNQLVRNWFAEDN